MGIIGNDLMQHGDSIVLIVGIPTDKLFLLLSFKTIINQIFYIRPHRFTAHDGHDDGLSPRVN